jgi:ABC-type Fe3+-hydroxamate transport system substrate-binding protein
MRSEPWAAAAVIALTCAACSKETPKAPPSPAEASSRPAVAEPPAPAAAAAPEPAASAPTPEPAPNAAVVPPPPPQRVVTVVPAKERRIQGLLANAMARDTTGETERTAARAAARRAACATQACVDRSYAAQEASLRKWVGSEEIR